MGGETIITGHSTAAASLGFPRVVHALGAAAPRWWVMLDCTRAHPHAGARSNSLVFTQHKTQENKPSGSKPAWTSQLGFSGTNTKAELGHNRRSPHCFPQHRSPVTLPALPNPRKRTAGQVCTNLYSCVSRGPRRRAGSLQETCLPTPSTSPERALGYTGRACYTAQAAGLGHGAGGHYCGCAEVALERNRTSTGNAFPKYLPRSQVFWGSSHTQCGLPAW